MDIYEYAKMFDADYYDHKTGNIYKIQNYNKAVRLGLPTKGIEVYDCYGNFLGIAKKKEF